MIIELKRLQTLFNAGQVSKIFEKPEDKEATSQKQVEELKTTEPQKNSTLPDVIDCPGCKLPTHRIIKDGGYIRCHRCKQAFVPGLNFTI